MFDDFFKLRKVGSESREIAVKGHRSAAEAEPAEVWSVHIICIPSPETTSSRSP